MTADLERIEPYHPTDHDPVQWKNICRSLHMAGLMRDFSLGECRRVNKLLMKSPTCEKVGHGLYRVKPQG